MKIIIAMDSFKGTLSAREACGVVSKAISKLLPDGQIISKPIADGGEGTAQAMLIAKGGTWIRQKVMGPLPDMQVEAGFAWFENERIALVEMATASGIELLSQEQLNPMKTTTYGTGQLIKASIEFGAEKILLAVGGSATVDGGVGAATSLGWQFLDENKNLITLGGGSLAQIYKIIKPEKLNLPEIEVLCDVDNPLCGQHGAAKVYGPQKGATSQIVEKLESGLINLSGIVETQLNKKIKDIPGAGAAGGLAAGAVGFMDAKLVSGIDTIIKESNLEGEMRDADWVITGEGSFDHQSLMGKVISGICKIAMRHDIKVAVIAGQVFVPEDEYKKHGIVTAVQCKKENISLNDALKNSKKLLSKATEKLIKIL
jgi:glycerate kinase